MSSCPVTPGDPAVCSPSPSGPGPPASLALAQAGTHSQRGPFSVWLPAAVLGRSPQPPPPCASLNPLPARAWLVSTPGLRPGPAVSRGAPAWSSRGPQLHNRAGVPKAQPPAPWPLLYFPRPPGCSSYDSHPANVASSNVLLARAGSGEGADRSGSVCRVSRGHGWGSPLSPVASESQTLWG